MEEAINKSIKILVTGANGQLGRCLQDVSVGYAEYDFHFKSSIDLDITSNEEIGTLFEQENYDYCINCAAYTAVDKAESEKEKAYLVNAEAVWYLAEACKAVGATLIHISTDFVFDGTKGAPYTEEDTPNPINVYGASKLKGEQYIQGVLTNYFIIRTSWVYSEYGHNFVKTMLRLGSEKDEIGVVNDQIGSPTYAGDLAEVILKIISSKATKYGLYHYSNDGSISWYEYAVEIFTLKQFKVKVNPIGSREFNLPAKRPFQSVLDYTNIKVNFKLEIPAWNKRLKELLLNLDKTY
jgi:dTDP-4-dehydrorhamnose reductase